MIRKYRARALLALVVIVVLGVAWMPTAARVRLLIGTVAVAERLLRPTQFRADYQPVYERIQLMAAIGMGSGFDGLEASGEAQAIQRYRAHLSPAPGSRLVFIDGGAFEGGYSEGLLDAFKDWPTVEVHAFEPASAAFSVLKDRHRSDRRVKANQLAIGDAPGRLLLGINAAPRMNSLVVASRQAGDPTEEVEVVTLDDYAAANGIAQIDILKLDIEGYEANALRGASRLLAERRIRIVQFEFGSFSHENHVTFADLATLLGEGTEIYRIVRDGLVPAGAWRAQDAVGGNYAAFLPQ